MQRCGVATPELPMLPCEANFAANLAHLKERFRTLPRNSQPQDFERSPHRDAHGVKDRAPKGGRKRAEVRLRAAPAEITFVEKRFSETILWQLMPDQYLGREDKTASGLPETH